MGVDPLALSSSNSQRALYNELIGHRMEDQSPAMVTEELRGQKGELRQSDALHSTRPLTLYQTNLRTFLSSLRSHVVTDDVQGEMNKQTLRKCTQLHASPLKLGCRTPQVLIDGLTHCVDVPSDKHRIGHWLERPFREDQMDLSQSVGQEIMLRARACACCSPYAPPILPLPDHTSRTVRPSLAGSFFTKRRMLQRLLCMCTRNKQAFTTTWVMCNCKLPPKSKKS
ncbi:hypothetical protein BC834DRAFT_523211 [Gloeopeniophorella convolvens]|nr:hypothetical protein BC834DRAFT_523211 [Gloeopeniophorella convolvens]